MLSHVVLSFEEAPPCGPIDPEPPPPWVPSQTRRLPGRAVARGRPHGAAGRPDSSAAQGPGPAKRARPTKPPTAKPPRSGVANGACRLPADHASRRSRVRVMPKIGGQAVTLTDELGKLARENAQKLRHQGWRRLIAGRRGRPNISRTAPHWKTRHACTFVHPPWTQERRDAAVARGPHPSAAEHSDFLREEMLEMCRRGQWMVLPYSEVRTRSHLRISPPGVIPQR